MRWPQQGEGPKQYLQFAAKSIGDDVYSGVVEPAAKLANKTAGHAASMASEAYTTYGDLQAPGLSNKTKASRGLEAVGRIGLGDIGLSGGAAAGASVGGLVAGPPGALVGGALGAAGGSLLGAKAPNYIRDKVVPNFKFPSEQIQSTRNPTSANIR
jgi:hypothetical protein